MCVIKQLLCQLVCHKNRFVDVYAVYLYSKLCVKKNWGELSMDKTDKKARFALYVNQSVLWLFEAKQEIITTRWQTIRIEVKEKPKLVLFFLNQKVAAEGNILEEIKDNEQELKKLSCLSVVVKAGDNDLADSLYCLMKQNRKAAAEKLSA